MGTGTKFALPDEATLERLAELDALGELSLSAPLASFFRDIYLDTTDRALLAAGYCCRRRESGAGILVTVKTVARADGGEREELELEMPAYRPPAEWMASPGRELILGIAGDRDLVPLVELEEERRARVASREEVEIGMLSLDSARIEFGGRVQRFMELEFELRPEGTERDLDGVVRTLSEGWNLRPEQRSNFERALEFLGLAATEEELLGDRGRAACARLALRRDAYGRRARAMLAFDAGATASEAGSRAGLSARRAAFWLGEYESAGMDIFPLRIRADDDLDVQAPQQGEALGIEMGDSMTDTARKILVAQFERMIDREKGALAGKDAEELHGMRVAIEADAGRDAGLFGLSRRGRAQELRQGAQAGLQGPRLGARPQCVQIQD